MCDELGECVMTLEIYKTTHSGRELFDKCRHTLDETGIWEVRGEDSNCDFGGHHHEPFIAWVEGKLEDVLSWALKHKKFVTWGSGGRITKVVPTPVEKLVTADRAALEKQIRDLQKLLGEL